MPLGAAHVVQREPFAILAFFAVKNPAFSPGDVRQIRTRYQLADSAGCASEMKGSQ
jgi:hypothetical protein